MSMQLTKRKWRSAVILVIVTLWCIVMLDMRQYVYEHAVWDYEVQVQLQHQHQQQKEGRKFAVDGSAAAKLRQVPRASMTEEQRQHRNREQEPQPEENRKSSLSIDVRETNASSSGDTLNQTASLAHGMENMKQANNATNATCNPQRPMSWEWLYFSNSPNGTKVSNSTETGESVDNNSNASSISSIGSISSTNAPIEYKQKQKNMLIATFAGFDKYASMLELTAPINKAYARKWKQDFVVLQGTSFVQPEVDGTQCTPHGRRTTLNKIKLLLIALRKRGKYDQLLILDTDAMIYDFDRDLTTLLDDKYMVAAHRVSEVNPAIHTHNINAGVTLWNLKHPMTHTVAKGWEMRSVRSIREERFQGDQLPLHNTLRKHKDAIPYVYAMADEFAYGHATVIKHFIRRRQHKEWSDPKILDERVVMIHNATNIICDREVGVCDGIELIEYGRL